MPFPDPPGPRMAYDRDGSVGILRYGSSASVLTPAQMAGLNSEIGTFWYPNVGDDASLLVFFPQLRDLLGVWGIVSNNGAINTHVYYQLSWSTDSSNGYDGNWTQFSSWNSDTPTSPQALQWGGSAIPNYRTGVVPFSITGIKAFKLDLQATGLGGGGAIFEALHLYGNYSTGDVEDVLLPWDPVLNQALKFLNFGDIQRTTTGTQSLRVKNASAAKTAHQVVLSTNTLYDSTPSLTTEFAFSTDGGTTWQTNPNIGDLAPGALSSVIQVRDQVPINETLGPFALRIIGSASGGWS